MVWGLASSVVVAEERHNPARFIDEISAFGQQQPEKGGIVFVGSSSFRLWPHLKEDFPGLPVLNRGFGGCVSNDMIVYFETLVARHEPKVLVTYCGGNDIHEKIPLEDAEADYVKFLTMSHERFPQLRVVVTSVKIAPQRSANIPLVNQFNEFLTAWCHGKDWVRFVDSTTCLRDAQGLATATLFRQDGIHLNEAGYAKWQEILEPVVREEWQKVN